MKTRILWLLAAVGLIAGLAAAAPYGQAVYATGATGGPSAPDATVPVRATVDYSTTGTSVGPCTADAGTCVNLTTGQVYEINATDPSLPYCIYHEKFYTPAASEPVITACAATTLPTPTGTWPWNGTAKEIEYTTATPAIGCDAGVCGSTTARVCAATMSGSGCVTFKPITYR
jgi:hypothetical protein